ncbi:DUF1254 domain-containing protein [Pararhizobium sp.]|uniref:DUF1254 domain-containing protein n=1 Tax=Pararhizobium sp. TaxID=1977563 RepID=UPI0027211FC3|nr:DUF1254 domain-containing protein [Pararhizobium sp.]MDO9417331.1 DUF1254 domain-containing protein [Pararhizobium sp.]
MRAVILALLTGLVGAALLHIVIILALPQFTGRDAYTKVMALAEPNRFVPLPNTQQDGAALVNDDPFLRVAVCSFSIAAAPVRFQARSEVPLWTLSIYDVDSNEIFSMNDKTSVAGDLDLVIATPVQLVALRKALPDALSESILAEMPHEDGYAVLRALSPAASFEDEARNFLAEASCDEVEGR